jgi:protocatechuate 3,4-dioxygenase, beta subunit
VDSDHRRFLHTVSLLATGSMLPAWATDLVPTPAQVRGPFYPITFPLDQDNDLLSVRGRPGTAYGMITNIAGQVLDDKGRPQAGVRVEIWQVNGYERYHHAGGLPAGPSWPIVET